MLKKAESSITKDLDLVLFIRRQRLQTFTKFATLNLRQRFVVEKMETMLIRESSDLDDSTSEDDELEQVNEFDLMYHGRKIVSS